MWRKIETYRRAVSVRAKSRRIQQIRQAGSPFRRPPEDPEKRRREEEEEDKVEATLTLGQSKQLIGKLAGATETTRLDGRGIGSPLSPSNPGRLNRPKRPIRAQRVRRPHARCSAPGDGKYPSRNVAALHFPPRARSPPPPARESGRSPRTWTVSYRPQTIRHHAADLILGVRTLRRPVRPRRQRQQDRKSPVYWRHSGR